MAWLLLGLALAAAGLNIEVNTRGEIHQAPQALVFVTGPSHRYCHDISYVANVSLGLDDCKQRCKDTDSCQFISFWNENEYNWCHLTSICDLFHSQDPNHSISIWQKAASAGGAAAEAQAAAAQAVAAQPAAAQPAASDAPTVKTDGSNQPTKQGIIADSIADLPVVEETLKLPFGGQVDPHLPAEHPTCSPGYGNFWVMVQLVVDTTSSSDCILGDIADDGSLSRGLCSAGRWAWTVEGQEDGSVKMYNLFNHTLTTDGTRVSFDGEFDRWFIIRTALDTYKIMSGDHRHNYLGHKAIGKFGITSVGAPFAIYLPSATGVASTMAATLPALACNGTSQS